MRFRNLKLGTKQMIGFGLILAIMAGVNIFSINRMATIKFDMDQVTTNWLPRAIAVSDINLNTSDLRLNQLQHAVTSDDAKRQLQSVAMIELIEKINENRDTYENLTKHSEEQDLHSEQEHELYDNFDQKWDTYQGLSLEFFQLSRSDSRQKALALLDDEARDVFYDFSEDLVELVNISKRDALAAATRAENTFVSIQRIFITLLVVTIILSIAIALLLVRLITIPIKKLVQAAGKVAQGDLDARLDISSTDEVGTLAHSFNQMTAGLKQAREKERQEAKLLAEAAELRAKANEAEAKALKAENERKTHELEEARKLQLAMLPSQLPDVPHLNIAAFMQPATEVGGDYYDFKMSEDGTLTIAIGDATGHGTKAGIIVTAVKSLFEVLASQQNIADIFKKITHALRAMNLGGKMFMAMTLVKVKGYKMNVMSAGMPMPLIWRSDTKTVEEVDLKGMPLGSFSEFPYEEREIDLFPGDTVVLMSDGLPEMFDPNGETLDYPTMNRLVEEADDKSPDGLIEFLRKSGEEWAKGRPAEDDVTFVTMQVK